MSIDESNKEQAEIEMGTKLFLFERAMAKLIDFYNTTLEKCCKRQCCKCHNRCYAMCKNDDECCSCDICTDENGNYRYPYRSRE